MCAYNEVKAKFIFIIYMGRPHKSWGSTPILKQITFF